MIELQHIQKVFNRGQVNEVTALQEVNLHIEEGEFVVLVGANGSGKTTLLNLIAGAVRPSAGRILLHGRNVTSLPEHRRARWIARVFQDPLGGTAPELSVIDNFRLAALRTHHKGLTIGVNAAFRKKVQEEVAQLQLGLEDKLQQPMGSLSGGQRQALTMLMTGMDRTDILLLDEPTAALDPRSAQVVMDTARLLIEDRGLTTLFITHNLEQAVTYGDRLLFMSAGKIARDLGPDEKAKLSLQKLQGWFG